MFCTNKVPTSHGPIVEFPNGTTIHPTHRALLPFPQISLAARQSHVFPAPQSKSLHSIGQFCDNGFRVLFDKDWANVFKRDTSILGTRHRTNGVYYISLHTPTSPVHSEEHSAYDMTTKTDLVQFLRRTTFGPVFST